MREVFFIKTNKNIWLSYEKVLKSNSLYSPDYLSDMYIKIMKDLAFAKTYYPKSKTTLYLNSLAAKTYQKIYKTKRIEQNKLKHFFLNSVPLTVYQYKKTLWFTVIIFLMFVGIGVLSTYYDEDFTRHILGNTYVNTTISNIENDDAMGIYKSGGSLYSFLLITGNNLYVGLQFFLYGLTAGLGTLLFLLENSIMLGTFQFLFIKERSFLDSFKGIWLHGAMEITAMVIEAFAGFIIASSILFPKTFSRINSLKKGFKDAFIVFVATIPFTVFAGFIEGFITRYAKEMPDFLNYLIIFGSFSVIVFYFFIFPKKVYNKSLI